MNAVLRCGRLLSSVFFVGKLSSAGLTLRSPLVSFCRGKSKMSTSLTPPSHVRGMTVWDPEKFSTSASVPCVKIQPELISKAQKTLKKYCLKMRNLRSVVDMEGGGKFVLLNPDLVKSFEDISIEDRCTLKEFGLDEHCFEFKDIDVTVDNWKTEEVLKAVLPDDKEGFSGFSVVGHIAHLNLKEHLEPFKQVIGQVLLRTYRDITAVVNKTNTIDNTFRNFAMEVLAGETDFHVSVKENGTEFQFDFSKVYWNPRLSTEHSRIISMMNKNSLLLDACAGVGPFSVPAAKICKVMANDLNPESYKWLCKNSLQTKTIRSNITCYNKDAREFIKTDVKDALEAVWTGQMENIDNIHITMNLPAMAVEFLDAFQGLFSANPSLSCSASPLPQVHVYSFSKSENPAEDVKEKCEEFLGEKLEENLVGVSFVRNVAPNKDMMRASFFVPKTVLFASQKCDNGSCKRGAEQNGSEAKKHKIVIDCE